MAEYALVNTNTEEYDRLVIFLTHENFYDIINKVEEELKGTDRVKVLFDMLFMTGNGYNRFASCDYENGKFDFQKAKIAKPSDYFRKETVQWLHNNYKYVNSSILTKKQRQNVRDNIAF